MCFQYLGIDRLDWEGAEKLDFLRDLCCYKQFVVMHQARIHIVLESKTMQAHYITKKLFLLPMSENCGQMSEVNYTFPAALQRAARA